MKKKDQKIIESRYFGRRQFLYGMGSTLFLPTLVSLMPKALAAEAQGMKKLALFTAELGMYRNHILPNGSAISALLQSVSGVRHLRTFELKRLQEQISYIIDTDFNQFRDDGTLNIYAGLDNYADAGHCWGALTGQSGGRAPGQGRSMDIHIQNSAFHKNLQMENGIIRMINSRHGSSGNMAWDRNKDANGNDINGSYLDSNDRRRFYCFRPSGVMFRDGDVFNRILGDFKETTTSTPPPAPSPSSYKKLLVDRVLEDYKALKNHRRISSSDKVLLDRFVDGVASVQTKLEAPAGEAPQISTSNITQQRVDGIKNNIQIRPEERTDKSYSQDKMWDNIAEIAVLALASNSTRMFHYHYQTPNWAHHDIDDNAEQKYGSKPQLRFIKAMPLKVAKKLKEFQTGSGNLLDETLVLYINEHAERRGHSPNSIPMFSIGKFNGGIDHGKFLDYRQRDGSSYRKSGRGYPIKSFMMGLMEQMGVKRSEYMSDNNGRGFGHKSDLYYSNGDTKKYVSQRYPTDEFGSITDDNSVHNRPIPFLFKG